MLRFEEELETSLNSEQYKREFPIANAKFNLKNRELANKRKDEKVDLKDLKLAQADLDNSAEAKEYFRLVGLCPSNQMIYDFSSLSYYVGELEENKVLKLSFYKTLANIYFHQTQVAPNMINSKLLLVGLENYFELKGSEKETLTKIKALNDEFDNIHKGLMAQAKKQPVQLLEGYDQIKSLTLKTLEIEMAFAIKVLKFSEGLSLIKSGK